MDFTYFNPSPPHPLFYGGGGGVMAPAKGERRGEGAKQTELRVWHQNERRQGSSFQYEPRRGRLAPFTWK